MSTEELLKPRYKVIADYPNSGFKVGDICSSVAPEWTTDEQRDFTLSEMAKYPHLFKPLQWWEEREDLSELKFLKDVGDGEIFKAEPLTNGMCYILPNKKNGGDLRYTTLKHFIPSTESEYNEYLKQLK